VREARIDQGRKIRDSRARGGTSTCLWQAAFRGEGLLGTREEDNYIRLLTEKKAYKVGSAGQPSCLTSILVLSPIPYMGTWPLRRCNLSRFEGISTSRMSQPVAGGDEGRGGGG